MIENEITKLEIFDVLKNINNKNFKYLETLSEDHQKLFSPYVVFQWLQSSNDKNQLLILNHINKMIFKLQDHPDLVYKLFCVSTNEFKHQKYSWMIKKNVEDESINIISEYFNVSKRIAKLYKKLYTQQDVNNMAKELGYQQAEIKKLKL